jgi:hypothetical protein
MPKKPNYSFQKQQKEQAREKKREAKAEEKRQRKAEADAASVTPAEGEDGALPQDEA